MRMDNGPELVSLTLAQWAEEHGVMLEFIRPGKPTQNAFIERFNRTYRTEILDFYLFRTLNEAREITERWLVEYNGERPHESLNNLTPEEYRLMAEPRKSQKVRGTKTSVLTEIITYNGALTGGVKVAQDRGGKAGGEIIVNKQ
ncbi:integrase catalytic subunit [Klebsiella variicola]|nr:integrase catalytic subunit [Klebsiella variicola]